MYVDHLNSHLFTSAGRRFHSIMNKESIKQGQAFTNSISANDVLYNDPVFVVIPSVSISGCPGNPFNLLRL